MQKIILLAYFHLSYLKEGQGEDDYRGRAAGILGLVEHHLEGREHGAGVPDVPLVVGRPLAVVWGEGREGQGGGGTCLLIHHRSGLPVSAS